MDVKSFVSKFQQDKQSILPPFYTKAVDSALKIQVHTKGIMPRYLFSGRGIKKWVTPPDYDLRFDDIFSMSLLQRHPNEDEKHYHWRLSVYEPLSKDIFTRFYNNAIGSIFQSNNYAISSNYEPLDNWIEDKKYDLFLKQNLKFILNNPYFFRVIIEGHRDEFARNEGTEPMPILVAIEDVLMYDGLSIAFKYQGYTYFLDKKNQYILLQGEGDTFKIIATYNHGFNQLPAKLFTHEFLDGFKYWANLLVRNSNEDEAMVKHYSYPIKQLLSGVCPTCNGNKVINDPERPDCGECTVTCKQCNGLGVLQSNPGEVYLYSEEELRRNGGGNMPDVARFINPDINIPRFHSDRVQAIYDKCEKALFINKTDASQSGVAKLEDKQDKYTFFQALTQFIFDGAKWDLSFIGKYLNVKVSNGEPIHEDVMVHIKYPSQFELMSDTEVLMEYNEAAKSTDNTMILSEVLKMAIDKTSANNAVLKKINEVLYFYDNLYGQSGTSERQRLLSQTYDRFEVFLHEKGYKMLVRMADRMGSQDFISMDNNAIYQALESEIRAMIPTSMFDATA